MIDGVTVEIKGKPLCGRCGGGLSPHYVATIGHVFMCGACMRDACLTTEIHGVRPGWSSEDQAKWTCES